MTKEDQNWIIEEVNLEVFQKIKKIKADQKTHLLLVEQNNRDKLAIKREESKSKISETFTQQSLMHYAQLWT